MPCGGLASVLLRPEARPRLTRRVCEWASAVRPEACAGNTQPAMPRARAKPRAMYAMRAAHWPMLAAHDAAGA